MTKLSLQNQAYYAQLAAYVNDAVGVDRAAAEAALAKVHAELLQRQTDGTSAADHLGQDPEKLGQQIVAKLPHRTWRYWLGVLAGAWVFSLLVLSWYFIFSDSKQLALGSAAVLAAILPLTMLVNLVLQRRRLFAHGHLRNTWDNALAAAEFLTLILANFFPRFGWVRLPEALLVGVGFGATLIIVGLGIWSGMHSWLIAALLSLFATIFALPAIDQLGTLPGWWGRLLIPILFVLFLLIIRLGDQLWPDKWQAGGKSAGAA